MNTVILDKQSNSCISVVSLTEIHPEPVGAKRRDGDYLASTARYFYWKEIASNKVQQSAYKAVVLYNKHTLKAYKVLANTKVGFPSGCVDVGSIPGSGRSPGEGNGNPLQYSCLENPMDRGAWWATVHRVAKSWTQLRVVKRVNPKCSPYKKEFFFLFL